jgi:hypothetical protein
VGQEALFMMNITVTQAIDIWCDLESACQKTSGYITIYAYRLMPYNLEYIRNRYAAPFTEEHEQMERDAADSLYQILELFKRKHECAIKIEDKELGEWFRHERFIHRIHVTIIQKK